MEMVAATSKSLPYRAQHFLSRLWGQTERKCKPFLYIHGENTAKNHL